MSNHGARRLLCSACVRVSLATLIVIGGMSPTLKMPRVQAEPNPAIIYVTETDGVDGDGLSWETAFSGDKLQYAIDNAPEGAQVWVAKGTYYPNKTVDPGDARSAAFQL